MYHRKSPLKGLMVGSISGLVGTVIMTQFQNSWNKASQKSRSKKAKSKESDKEKKEDSTMKAAGKMAETTGNKLSRAEKKKAGLWVHYAFGTAVGAIYGLGRESVPNAYRLNSVIAGAGYGTAVFVGAHEIAVPAMKLSSKPAAEPLPDHAFEFFAHLVYGIGTALTYRILRDI